MGLHAFAFQSGKEKLLAKTTPSVTRRLTVIRGSGNLRCHTTEKGFRDGDVSGAFFLSFVCSCSIAR